jgi:hypothetical protein
MKSTMIAGAVSGILLGLNGCAASTPPASSPADAPVGATATAPAKHACKGQNECRSQGACKTDKHACKGQNECRSQGGCKTVGFDAAPVIPK